MADHHLYPAEPVPRRRSPAGQAIAVALVALLLGSLLNAERLDHTARTQPFGWQRTWAMRVTGPLATISRATGLNLPRKLLSEAAGNEDPPPPIETDDVRTADERAALAPATTTTTTAPPRVPTAAEPLRVLVAGDSLMGWIGPALTDELGVRPATIIEDWQVSTGLARPDVLNWPAQLAQDMAAHDPEVVIVGFGGNDAQDMATADGVVRLGTPAWAEEYQRRVVQVLDAVEAPGRTVYWIGLPLTTASNIERAAPVMTDAVQTELEIRPWASFVDARTALSPDGEYVTYLPDGSGRPVKVREDDGVHPNPAGARRIVATMVDDLIEDRNLGP